MTQIFRTAALAANVFFLVVLAGAVNAQSVSPNDTARYLAGLRPSTDSAFIAFTQDRAWQAHADRFNTIFGKVDGRQLSRIRAWSSAKLTSPSPVLFYMFSGPDFLYANAFFPSASTYVMSGLEPVGPIPDLMKMSGESVSHSLRNIEVSLNSILAYSFFQTKDMRRSLIATRVSGTLPILYVFLARSGKTIRDVSLIRLADDGSVLPDDGVDNAERAGRIARGAKIVFAGEDGQVRTLYYFSTNVANDGFKASGFARFCERLGTGDALVKSASYLMHANHFSDVRNFLLGHTRLMLQDDTGVPVAYFDQRQWQLRPFGHYTGPIGLFPGRYQPGLAQLFDEARAEPIDFGIGYRWRPQSSNLMLATRAGAATPNAVASAEAGSVAGKDGLVEPAAPDSANAQTETGAKERKSGQRAAAGRKSAARTASRAQRPPGWSDYFTPWPFRFTR